MKAYLSEMIARCSLTSSNFGVTFGIVIKGVKLQLLGITSELTI